MLGYFTVRGMEKVGFLDSLSEDNIYGHMRNLLVGLTSEHTAQEIVRIITAPDSCGTLAKRRCEAAYSN